MIPVTSKSRHQDEFQKEGPYHQPEYIVIRVVDPVTAYDEQAKPYTTYEIRTETTFPQFKGREFSVRRRYSDFVTLQKICNNRASQQDPQRKHGALPPLPGDSLVSLFGVGNVDEYLIPFCTTFSDPYKPGRFDPDFIEQRRKGLETFLNAAANHTLIRFEPELQKFLTDPKHVLKAPAGWF